MRRRDFTLGLGALALAGCATRSAARADDLLVFAYFTTGKGEADGPASHNDDGKIGFHVMPSWMRARADGQRAARSTLP